MTADILHLIFPLYEIVYIELYNIYVTYIIYNYDNIYMYTYFAVHVQFGKIYNIQHCHINTIICFFFIVAINHNALYTRLNNEFKI